MSIYKLAKKYQNFNPYSNQALTQEALKETQRKTLKIIKKESDHNVPEDCFKQSVIGGVNICRPGESWPIAIDGTFLLPVIQINMKDLPFVPLNLKEVKFITLFVYPEEGIIYNDDSSFCIRCYQDEKQLEYLKTPNSINNIPQLIHFQEALDFPSSGEISMELIKFINENYNHSNDKSYECVVDDKLFGWPFWCQSSELSANIEFIMQITDYDEDWISGDCPTIYVIQDLDSKKLYATMQMY